MPILSISSSSSKRNAGFSLVEMMISVAIGLILLLGLTSILTHTSQTRTELEKSSRQIENGRYATQLLTDAVHHAGYYGDYFCQPDTAIPALCTPASPPTPLGALPDPCVTALADLNYTRGLPLPIQGYDGTALATVPSCISSSNYKANTDMLVLRRTNTSVVPLASVADHSVYMQTTSVGYVLATRSGGTWTYRGTSSGADDLNSSGALPFFKKDGATMADLRRYTVQIYFVSPCSVPAGGGTTCTGASDDGGTPIPTLKMVELSSDGTSPVMSTPISLVEGIENLQIDYGIDSDVDGSPNRFTTCSSGTPCSLDDWSNVVAMRVHILARNTETSVGYSDNKQYDLGLGGITVATNDGYKRHLYSTLVRAVNPSGRREQ